jgi:hypothetical protein
MTESLGSDGGILAGCSHGEDRRRGNQQLLSRPNCKCLLLKVESSWPKYLKYESTFQHWLIEDYISNPCNLVDAFRKYKFMFVNLV